MNADGSLEAPSQYVAKGASTEWHLRSGSMRGFRGHRIQRAVRIALNFKSASASEFLTFVGVAEERARPTSGEVHRFRTLRAARTIITAENIK